ncbi:MAG TPA: polysaccharide deacetylase family protein [Gaiellaceae bacterium]|nr:polysaccharide deacetylase family protein [Gaiellaceae bacterium]
MTEQADLAPGPALLYPLKAAHTRLRSLAWLARGARAPATPGFRILFYHRVSDDRDELAVSPRRFREQLEHLAAEGYRGVDVLTALEAAPGAVGIAFDDGYLDVAEHALPELERHGFSATVFVATGVTDGRVKLSWYRRQPPLLGWDDIRRLDGGALRFEAHTVAHPNLLAVGEERAREEITASRRELEDQLGREVSAFCYPAGLFSERDVELVAEAGYRVACTCEPGVNTPRTDPLRLHRIQVDARDGLLDFRAKLGGGFDEPSQARAAWRRLRYRASSRS